jgi:hypothetical protein
MATVCVELPLVVGSRSRMSLHQEQDRYERTKLY